ncbi:MAG: DNA recombination protein RmuC [Pseudomonadota bacterium]
MDIDAPLVTFGATVISLRHALLGSGVLVLLVGLVLVIWRSTAGRARADRDAARAAALETALAEMRRVQAEMSGRMQTMAEIFGDRQSDMGRVLGERLDGLSHRLGRSMADTTRNTSDSLRHLHERIAVIDRAQETITNLSGQVHDLRQILSDKQKRGIFGQGRMEAIIQDGLPAGSYVFQPVLSNGCRPDCVIAMPNGAPGLVVDAKFPLEAFRKGQIAETEEEADKAQRQFKRDIAKHVLDIRDKYLVPGETQDTAFMFVPSESLFAELHEVHTDLVQKAHRVRVVIVSPALLMLAVQVMQALLKDVRMREEAHVIRTEVGKLLEDVERLGERVANLRKHFDQAGRDVDQIVVSSEKIARRGGRIEGLEFDPPSAESGIDAPSAQPSSGLDPAPGIVPFESRTMGKGEGS